MKVAVLGGGMAGLTAAWALSRDCEVTVYEREWRLGGKGASVRGEHGRIEEHGLHVWLGYYDNAFRLMRQVYGELDRGPEYPIRGWRDAFVPAGHVGVEDGDAHWLARFDGNELEPGLAAAPSGPLSIATVVQRGLRLLLDFVAASEEVPEPAPAGVFISASPEPPRAAGAGDLARAVRQAEVAALVAAAESLHLLRGALPGVGSLAPALLEFLERTRAELDARVARDAAARRGRQLADMVIAILRGCVRDELLGRPAAFAAIDHLDFREWLARHGAAEETLRSPLLRGMYDLVFAYEEGDPDRPRFSAGLGLFLATKLFFDYKGAIFWKLAAGMGDVVFAPLYEALAARGVRFALGHRVERLHLEAGRVAAVSFLVDLDEGVVLERVRGLPCFPARAAAHTEPLRVEDFDAVVLAMGLGAVPAVSGELLADSPRWREMVERVATVPTQALQVWLRAGEADVGWPHRGATVSGYVSPFDTYASMSHVLALEDWEDDAPRALGYFCSVLPAAAGADAAEANAEAFLDGPVRRWWPGFSPDLVAARYVRANVEPSERYVQSLPGTGVSRLPANGSGYANLFLAGDWVACGLDAGCVEAAVLAGLEAANAVRGRPLMDGILGSWIGP